MNARADADAVLGLALLADVLGRDLQRAARAAGSARVLWRSGDARLGELLRLDADALAKARETRRPERVAEARGRLQRAGVRLVPVEDPSMPERLRAIYDPPFGLFAEGDWDVAAAALAERPVVAIVGARRPSPGGRRFAEDLARGLARRGAVIASGLALGIDAAAHEGALDGGGLTVAVLGAGLASGYPRANRAIRERIAGGGGVVLSEYWLDTPPAPWRFPARNRVVAGLAHAVVVVEAGERSGALITTDFALEAGRPVLAVPGPPWAETSRGSNALIRGGAAVCCEVEDVVAETPGLCWHDDTSPVAPLPEGLPSDVHGLLLEAPHRADEIAARMARDPAAVAAALALLEMEGHAVRGEGQRYWATSRAGT